MTRTARASQTCAQGGGADQELGTVLESSPGRTRGTATWQAFYDSTFPPGRDDITLRICVKKRELLLEQWFVNKLNSTNSQDTPWVTSPPHVGPSLLLDNDASTM